MKNRRANHEGSRPILRSDGRYQCAVQINGKRRVFTGKTSSVAREKMKSWLRSSEAALPNMVNGHRSLSSLFDSYLEHVKESKADKTYRSYRSIIECHIKPRIGSLIPAKLRAGNIVEMLDDMRRSPIAIAGTPKHGRAKRLIGPRTCELTYVIVGAALKTVIPELLATVPKPKAQAEEMHPWTSADAARFLDYVDKTINENRTLFRVALRTGARKGELLALRVADFDAKRQLIQITKTYNEKLRRDGPTKTPSSRRSVALSKETSAVVTKYILAMGLSGHDRLFPISDVRTLAKRMQRDMREADVPVIRFHDFRHTFATLALAARIPVKVVSEMLGHKSVKLTLDVYAHTLPGMHESAIEVLEAAF